MHGVCELQLGSKFIRQRALEPVTSCTRVAWPPGQRGAHLVLSPSYAVSCRASSALGPRHALSGKVYTARSTYRNEDAGRAYG